jgi:NADP-dependent aldehyde dehydrogenase
VLEAVGRSLEKNAERLVATAEGETALGARRLQSEITRTRAQIDMYAGLIRDGSVFDVVISPSDGPARPDMRSMLRPLGPVAVFAASNFPFAFSTVGNDTASALAAGCSVVVKAHEAHPHTSLATLEVVRESLDADSAPDGLVTMVHGHRAGSRLVKEPQIRAVGFTGSLRGGRALFNLAAARPDPIPFFGELSSVNPVVVLPGTAQEDPCAIAHSFVESLSQGHGQFCTKPGLLFVPEDQSLLDELTASVGGMLPGVMLTAGMRDAYLAGIRTLSALNGVRLLAAGETAGKMGGHAVAPHVFQTDIGRFIADRAAFSREVFGPCALAVVYHDLPELLDCLPALAGCLAACVHASDQEATDAAEVASRLAQVAGRLVYNGWPTGVAVSWATHHGGPWPAATSARDSSVGARAISRWMAPIAYQDWPDRLLPAELRDSDAAVMGRRLQD